MIEMIPPQAQDYEQAILGSMMINSGVFDDVRSIISIDDFYSPKNANIFKCIETLYNAEQPYDLLCVFNEAKAKGLNIDRLYIAQLTDLAVYAANAKFYARVIAERHVQRTMIAYATEIQNAAYSEDVGETISLFAKYADDILGKTFSASNLKTMAESSDEFKAETIAKWEAHKMGVKNGIVSGFYGLDLITGGWQKTDLIIVGARPSMGKTAVAIEFAKRAAKTGEKVLFISIEMASVQLMQRFISGETDINSSYIRDGKLESKEINTICQSLEDNKGLSLDIDDTPSIKIEKIASIVKQKSLKNDIDIVIIDYLQLITTSGQFGSREQEVAHVSRSLKALAKTCNVPIIALAQLNRGVANSGDKRPQLSDLRESGSIEQDADVVLFVHRQAYYSGENDNKLELLCRKHRNGATGDTEYWHNNSMTQFKPYLEQQNEQIYEQNGKESQSRDKESKGLPF